MPIVKWCVLIACLLPMLTALVPKVFSLGKSVPDGKYDNNNPRAWAAKLDGWQQRAMAAHANGFEALPLFIACVLFAVLGHADPQRIDTLAMAFVGLRVVYVAVYLFNWGTLRTLVWTAAVATNVALLML
ncbi:MAG: MAPEG family protein [Burkholderiales bacterium]